MEHEFECKWVGHNYASMCSCGWKDVPFGTREAAKESWENHREEPERDRRRLERKVKEMLDTFIKRA